MAFHEYPYTDFHEMNLDWVIKKVKELATAWAQVQQDWTDEQAAFANLQSWIENYFNNLNVQTEINVKLDAMVEAGTMSELIAPFVASGLPAVVADQIGAVVAAQIGPVVAAQIGAVVADQLPAVAAAAAAAEVSAWLALHVNPDTGYVIDDSFTVQGAAADAKAVGDEFTAIKSALSDVVDYVTVEDYAYESRTVTSNKLTQYKVDDSRGYIGNDGNFNKNTGYLTYYVLLDADGYAYYYDNLDNNFCMTALYSAMPFSSSTLVGSVLNKDNAPKANNKLAVEKGQYLVISRPGSSSSGTFGPYDFGIYFPKTETYLDANLKLANEQLEQAKAYVNYGVKNCMFKYRATTAAGDSQIYYSDKAQHVLSIYIPAKEGYLNYNIGKSSYGTQAGGGYEVTRMCVLYAVDDTLEKRFDITRPGEWEMAVKISGRDDFIGGFEHGDEWETECEYFVDGTKVNITTFTTLTEFNEIRVKNVSNMYDPNDHETLVGYHGREWIFTKDKAELYQSIQWLFQVDTLMTASYMTMFPIIRGNDSISEAQISDHFYTDINYADVNCASAGFSGSLNKDTKKVTIYGVDSGVNASVEILEYPDYPNSKYCYVVAQANKANKIYYGICGYDVTKGTVTPNQVWRSKSIYRITMGEGTSEE